MNLFLVKYSGEFSHVERYIACDTLANIPIIDNETLLGIERIEVIKEKLIIKGTK